MNQFKTVWMSALMLFITVVGYAQTTRISGKVTDPSGEEIIGANVQVKGATIGTITDFEGNFLLDVPTSGTLVVSYIGYKPYEISLGRTSVYNIVLTEDSEMLQEVVVVGYGTQRKQTLTGAVETILSETFQDRAVTSPALALQGQSPGLVVTRGSGRPGNEDISFQIRGETSVNGGDPLIVIDGTPVVNKEQFYNMNSDDIESISVLKDASASIYGSRAANGVILVTTKRGKGKITVDFSSNLRINTIGIRPPNASMMEYATLFLDAAKEDGTNANYWGWANEANLLNMQAGIAKHYETAYWGEVFLGNYSRFDEMYGTAIANQQNVSISGASEKTSFRLSMGYAENIGALKTAYDGQKQYNIRLNADTKVFNWLKVESSLAYMNTHHSGPVQGLGITSLANDPPLFPSVNPYGQWYANFGGEGNRNAVAETIDGGRTNTYRDQVSINLGAQVDFTKDLNFRFTMGVNKDFYKNDNYSLTIPTYTWFGDVAKESINSGTSSIRQERKTNLYQNYGGFLNYNKTFLNDHTISAMVGITAEKNSDTRLYGYRLGFEDNGVYDINLGSQEGLIENSGGQGHWGLYSYVGRINYNYKNKYLLELNGRRDGSSKFHPDYRWSNFGGASVGWIVTEESFMKSIRFLDYLKVRASYGEMGNQSGINNYDYISTLGKGSVYLGQSSVSQYTTASTSMVSYTRTWERVGITNVGLDFQLFGNKVYGSVEYYEKKNNGMLVQLVYPTMLGGTAPKSNDGKLKTTGWEVMLGYRGKAGDVKYNVSLNLSDSKNNITSIAGAITTSTGKNATIEGYPMNSWWLYETDGYFTSEAEVEEYYATHTVDGQGILPNNTDTDRLRPGDIKIVDLNEDGKIDIEDLKYMGDAAPHINYGINLGVEWNGFDISGFFQGTMNQKIMRSGVMRYPFATLYTNQNPNFIGKTWTEENPDADYPRLTANVNRANWNYDNKDFMLQNNRYIRLKSLIVGYSFKNIPVSKYNIEKLRIYFSGNDLFEFTSVKDGYDPEFGDNSNNSYPFSRTWSFGVNITF